MTLFTGYAGWIQGVRDWLDLDIDNYPDSKIELFINLAHTRLNRELKALEQEKEISFDIPDGGYDLDTNLPDFGQVRSISYTSDTDYPAFVPLTQDEYYKHRMIAAGVLSFPSGRYGNNPGYFIIDGKIHFFPEDGKTITMIYYAKQPMLESGVVESNAFTDDFSDLLLNASCAAAMTYTREAENTNYEQQTQKMISDINTEADKQRFGSTPLRREIRSLS
jgi:hypothetical protein